MEREATTFEIASGMRSLFASGAEKGLTVSPEGIAHLIRMCDALVEQARRVDRTVEELAAELLADAAIAITAPVNTDHAAIARNAMSALHEYSEIILNGGLTDRVQRRIAMGLRVLAGSLRRIATDGLVGSAETASLPLLGKVR